MSRPAPRWRRLAAALAGLTLALSGGTPANADATRDKQWHLGSLRIGQAHQITQGDGVIVGLVDTGVDATHPDLVGNVLPGTDLLKPPGDGLHDPYGHGTAMAGLIAAHGHDGDAGALGIAPRAKVLPAVATTDSKFNSSTQVAQGMRWAIEHGARVLCVAVAANDVSEMEQAVAEAARADVVIVAGVGNHPDSSAVRYPAGYPGVVAAAGVDRAGEHAAISVTGREVLLSAPAVDVWSTKTGGGYRTGTGTSDSTAILAGVAALVRAKYPALSAPEVIRRMIATAVDLGAPGRDEVYGYGLVDPVAALTRDIPADPSGSAGPSAPASDLVEDDGSSSSSGLILIVLVLLLTAGGVIAVVAVRHRRGGGDHPAVNL